MRAALWVWALVVAAIFCFEQQPRSQILLLGAGKQAGGGSNSCIAPNLTNAYVWVSSDQSYVEDSGTPTTLITVDGTPIGSQLDRSGNGNHLYQAVVKPTFKTNILNSLPAARYNGTTDFLAGTSGGPTGNSFSMYLVVNRTTDNAGAGMISNDNAGLNPRFSIFGDGSGGVQVFNGGNGTASAMSSATYHLVAGSTDNTGSFPGIIQVDNNTAVPTNLPGSGGLGNVLLGRFFNRFWAGDIVEVILSTAVQSFSAGAGLCNRQYLNSRYNLGLGI